MKEIKKVEQIYYEVGLGCSNRAMYGVRDTIWNMAKEIDEELYDTSITSYCDYEGDLEKILFFYDKDDANHIELWKQICNKYEIEFKQDLEYSIYLTIF